MALGALCALEGLLFAAGSPVATFKNRSCIHIAQCFRRTRKDLEDCIMQRAWGANVTRRTSQFKTNRSATDVASWLDPQQPGQRPLNVC